MKHRIADASCTLAPVAHQSCPTDRGHTLQPAKCLRCMLQVAKSSLSRDLALAAGRLTEQDQQMDRLAAHLDANEVRAVVILATGAVACARAWHSPA